jgi:hypothetical protein
MSWILWAHLRRFGVAALVGVAASPASADWISDAFGGASAGGAAFMRRAPTVQVPPYSYGGNRYVPPPPAYIPPPPTQYGNPFLPPPQNFNNRPSTGYSGPPIRPNPQLYNPGNWATIAPPPPPPRYVPPPQQQYYYPRPPVTGFQPPMYQMPRR